MKRFAGLLRRLADRIDPQPRPWMVPTMNTTTCTAPTTTTIPILYTYPPGRVT